MKIYRPIKYKKCDVLTVGTRVKKKPAPITKQQKLNSDIPKLNVFGGLLVKKKKQNWNARNPAPAERG